MFCVFAGIHPLAHRFVVLADFLELGGNCVLVGCDAGAHRCEFVRHRVLVIDDDLLLAHSQGDGEQRAFDRLEVGGFHVPTQVIADLRNAVGFDALKLF
ncbi:hypothetical protein D3C71_1955400 [compost metagenome]